MSDNYIISKSNVNELFSSQKPKIKKYFSGFNIETLVLYLKAYSIHNDSFNVAFILPSSSAVGYAYELLKTLDIENLFLLNNDYSSFLSDYYKSIKAIHTNCNNSIFLLTYDDLVKYIPDEKSVSSNSIIFSKNQSIVLEDVVSLFIDNDYQKTDNVYEKGDFSVRGCIIDFFSHNNKYPVRIELFDDTIESIRYFNIETQRSLKQIDNTEIIFLNNTNEEKIMIHELLSKKNFTNLLYDHEVFKKKKIYLPFVREFLDENCFIYTNNKFLNQYSKHKKKSYSKIITVDYTQNSLLKKIEKLNCNNLIITYKYDKQKERLLHLLKDNNITNFQVFDNILEIKKFDFTIAVLKSSFQNTIYFEYDNIIFLPEERLYVSEDEVILFEPESKQYQNILDFNELKENDYVIHWNYGIGIYKGLSPLEIQGIKKDFLHIEYADNGQIFLPAEDFKYLTKYVPYNEDAEVEISSLNNKKWNNKKVRIKKKIADIAYELIELYSIRLQNKGFAYYPDNKQQIIFESKFSFEETPDQIKAIREVKDDMESDTPMDRLICGDVGYGKTEVAIRAAFKAATQNKQVAVLVPTTILTLQHYETFNNRLKDFNIKVDYLCRFTPASQQKELKENIKEGKIDIIIGTHKLIKDNIPFKDLGLLIIDEEQRFGVKDKEKIKLLKKSIDVLTLTATPIPRTLHLSLAGIRKISIIDTHPVKRLPIKTIVSKYDEKTIQKAIVKEIKRGGQIFFLHNNIESIEIMKNKILELVPSLKIKIVHGRMKPTEIENTMYEFYNGEFDLLLCTTIIENGLDISSVNTIIINNAERFGLSQLHQLRGRVGRADVQAYAYLFHRGIEALSEQAAERLKALQEYSDLGAGYKIAYKDLQIRGAGNLLGNEQSGVIMEIGYELYCQILKETIESLKPDSEKENIINIEYNISAFIPYDYIKNTIDRINFYKKIFKLKNRFDFDDLTNELTDRFGPIPDPLLYLIEIGYIRMKALHKDISEITLSKKNVIVTFKNITQELLENLKKSNVILNIYGNKPKSIMLGPYTEVSQMFKETKQLIEAI